jgi:AcrR family transcriptional regulator
MTMTIRVARKKPDSYQHGDLREALIQAGLKLLADGDPAALTLRAAAQLAGVSHAAPYRHFQDKQALVSAIAERGFRQLTAAMREELARCASADARQRMVALGLGYFRFAKSNPASLQVIFGGVLARKHIPPDLMAAGDEAYLTLRNEIAAGIARRELREGNPDQLALACWSLVHGASALLINGAIHRPPSASAERELVTGLLRLLGEGVYAGEAAPLE